MRMLRSMLLTAAMILLIAGQGVAQETVYVDESNPPFMYSGEGGKALGIYPALIMEMHSRLGQPATIQAVPWKRALDALEQGQGAVGGIYKNEERVKKFDYTDQLFSEELRLYVRAGEGFAYTGLESLKGKTVGVQRGWSYGDAFDAARKSGDIVVEEVSGDAANLDKLLGRRIDVVIAVSQAADMAMASGGMAEKVEMLATPFSVFSSYIAFNKAANKADHIARINDIIKAMHADGSFEKLVRAAVAGK